MALLVFLAPVAIFSLRHIRLDNNVENWLPEHDISAREYAWCREHFPEQELLFLTWEHSTINDPRLPILLGHLHGKVDEDGIRRGGLPFVESALHAGDMLTRMVDYGVDREEGIRRLQGSVIGRGWLKVRLSPAGLDRREATVARLIAEAQARFGIQLAVHEATSNWEPAPGQEVRFHELQERYPAREASSVAVGIDFGEHDLQVSWKGMSADRQLQDEFMKWATTLADAQGQPLIARCYAAAGSPIAVVIALSEAGTADKDLALAAIKRAAVDSFIPAEEIVLGGRVVSGAELNAAVIRAAWNPSSSSILTKSVIMLSGLVGIVFALISLRSIRLGLLVIGVSYYAALLGMSLVPLSGGSMNMVLVVMPTLLMVLSLSGAIHVANYWKHAVWENPQTAVARATKMAWAPCALAAFTTALGLISLAGSQLTPVREFGIYASIGTLISVAMVLYGLPALLQMAPLKRVQPGEVDPRLWRNFGAFLARHWRPATIISLVIPLVCGLGLQKFQIETKVIRYFPEDSQLVKDSQTMEDSLAGTCPVEVVIRFDEQAQARYRFLERLEIVRAVETEVRRHAEVSGTLSLADFQPVRAVPAESASAREKIMYNRRSHEAEKRIKTGVAVGASDLIAMTKTTPVPTDHPRAGMDELWRINAQCALMSDVDYDALTAELNAAVVKATQQYSGVDHFVTGTVPLFLRTQRAVLESLIWSFIMAFGLIALVMVWVLKDPVAGLISMVPNILPVLAVFGLVSWCGQRIDIGTMVTASVALGIAVDGTLHLLTWFQDGLRKGLSRDQSVIAALAHCAPAMWQTSAAVGLGLLVLMPAELLLISRFGWLMASLIAAALLGDIVLLPCLLLGALGRLIERGLKRRGEIARPVAVVSDLTIPAHHLSRAKKEDEARFVG